MNDLYVAPEARRNAVATHLMDAAKDYAKSVGAIKLTLSTEVTNHAAQFLYENQGWNKDDNFLVYQFFFQE